MILRFLGLMKITFNLVEKIFVISEELSGTENATSTTWFILSCRPGKYEVINLDL